MDPHFMQRDPFLKATKAPGEERRHEDQDRHKEVRAVRHLVVQRTHIDRLREGWWRYHPCRHRPIRRRPLWRRWGGPPNIHEERGCLTHVYFTVFGKKMPGGIDLERRVQDILRSRDKNTTPHSAVLVFSVGLLAGLLAAIACAPLHATKTSRHYSNQEGDSSWRIRYAPFDRP